MDYEGKCAYCHQLFPTSEEARAHQQTCDRYYPFKIELTSEFTGNVAGTQYHYHKGDIVEVDFDLYRIIKNLGICHRL